MKNKFEIGDVVQFKHAHGKFPVMVNDYGTFKTNGLIYQLNYVSEQGVRTYYAHEYELEKYVKSKSSKSILDDFKKGILK